MSSPSAPPSSTAASPPPPAPLKAPLLYRARGIFGALVSLNMLVAGYMLIRGPRSGHAKRTAIEDFEKRVRRDDVFISEIEQKLNNTTVVENSSPTPPPPSTTPQDESNVLAGPILYGGDDRQATSTQSVALIDDSSNVAEEVEQGFNNVTTSFPTKVALPDDEVRELLQWILDEKRRTKPQSWVERSRNDGDKRLLKQVLKEATLPQIQ